jgi:hypothetical protein
MQHDASLASTSLMPISTQWESARAKLLLDQTFEQAPKRPRRKDVATSLFKLMYKR